jgi:hypothetical protein
LRERGSELVDQLGAALGNSLEDPDKFFLAVYASTVCKELGVGDYPFEARNPRDEAVQQDRETIAFLAAQRVAACWLQDNPGSIAAREVSQLGLFAEPERHLVLLYEMWQRVQSELTVGAEEQWR